MRKQHASLVCSLHVLLLQRRRIQYESLSHSSHPSFVPHPANIALDHGPWSWLTRNNLSSPPSCHNSWSGSFNFSRIHLKPSPPQPPPITSKEATVIFVALVFNVAVLEGWMVWSNTYLSFNQNKKICYMQTFRDNEELYLATDSDKLLLICIPFIQQLQLQ
ncbi:uncharacterized protein LOC120706799 isoform X1 [Panicum virgatum]|nr:uncharacterized protein LOC120706799 isoform X1 [Panicum virgatum]XP_039847461.1 uncharacterized protein LOC120706799 isoform X1 [Panicum virgatum]XP_039847462.1 uncharacterized protein LOC120706799 isoform X1 [Panicum virgatum]XP_039847463.1 uncharacterized protein LOC120706799 isoform X1 [Panicum virgatum]XP_039847464.1 uncharacterized protein LOC120706799 isoform X1 [Panicum virgatum]XP_039847465.1 uncharacterized protein LOC120706799 isoform X1 [Panicum virgatum]